MHAPPLMRHTRQRFTGIDYKCTFITDVGNSTMPVNYKYYTILLSMSDILNMTNRYLEVPTNKKKIIK